MQLMKNRFTGYFVIYLLLITFLAGCTDTNENTSQQSVTTRDTSTKVTISTSISTLPQKTSKISTNIESTMLNKKSSTLEDISIYIGLTREEVFKELGSVYEIVPAGGEGTEDGFYYEDIGLSFVFNSEDSNSKIAWIDCYANVDINGAKNGMSFAQVMEVLGKTKVKDTFIETPDHKAYEIIYIIGNCIISYFSQNEDGREGGFTVFSNENAVTKEESQINPFASPESAIYSDYHPIVIDTCLIGGYKDGKWITTEQIEPFIKGNEKYTIVARDKVSGIGYGGPVFYHEASGSAGININSSVNDENPIVYYSGEWDPLPEVGVSQDNTDIKYVKSTKVFLKNYNVVVENPKIEFVYNIDIDSDDKDETFIQASYFKEDDFSGSPSVGDYSVVFAVKNNDGIEFYIPILIWIWDETNTECMKYKNKILSFTDLNGDGKVEFIGRSSYYEGYTYAVFEMKDNKFINVISGGDGA